MSILVYTEHSEGKFKKSSFELISYATELAKSTNSTVTALSIGKVGHDELNILSNYGATSIISVEDEKLNHLSNQAYTSVISQVADKIKATVILMAHNNTGKAIAPRIAVRLKAGLVSAVIGKPISTNPFIVCKKVYTGKALSQTEIKSPIKIITLSQNSFGINNSSVTATIENFVPQLTEQELSTKVKETNKITGKILINDAEIVVAGGRGMKGPENWNVIEDLANLLNAGIACSRPVSDEGWRSHDEHVGQTGKIIAPNLYFACGISGAIQHLGGVSSSKVIVAINKDKDAPIFEAANYGIIGDAMKVLPELTKAIKEAKS